MTTATIGLRTGTVLVAASRAATGGTLLVVGLLLGLSGRVGDFGIVVRAIAIAHLAVQFTDAGALAAFTVRSADPMTDELRQACRDWLSRRVGRRVALLAPVVAGATVVVDVPLVVGVVVFAALALQRLAAELLRSDGRVVAYALTAGMVSSGLWLLATLVVVGAGVEPTAVLVALLHAGSTAAVGLAGLGSARGRMGWGVARGHDGPVTIPAPTGAAGSAAGADGPDRPDRVLAGRHPLFVEGLLEAAVRNADVVLVSLVVGRDEAGLYAVASRLVAVAMTPLAAANGALAREYAERWARGGSAALSALARPVARRITGFPAAMVMGAVLVALWRSDDDAGTVALVSAILLLAATVSTAAGSAGLLLGICRQELASARISAAAIATSVVLLLVLGTAGGLVPAAVGFAVGVAAQNIGQAWYLRRSVGVVSHL